MIKDLAKKYDPRNNTKAHKKVLFHDASCDFVDRTLLSETRNLNTTRYTGNGAKNKSGASREVGQFEVTGTITEPSAVAPDTRVTLAVRNSAFRLAP